MPEIGFRGSAKIEQGFPATFLTGHWNGVSRFCPAAVKLSDYLPVRITTHKASQGRVREAQAAGQSLVFN
jgi:hypothetical protein